MKVYVLTSDTHNNNWGSSIELFGVFTTEEKAIKQASEKNLGCYDISIVSIDETKEQCYLGGYEE